MRVPIVRIHCGRSLRETPRISSLNRIAAAGAFVMPHPAYPVAKRRRPRPRGIPPMNGTRLCDW